VTRFRLTIEYDGRSFMGWQRQDHGASVQGSIETAIRKMTGETTVVQSAGRTDSGVHALAMSAHVDVAKPVTPFRLMEGINAHLRPNPVAIIACARVADDWHARFDCLKRSYRYVIVNRRAPLTLGIGRAWRVTRPLDAAAMHRAAQLLVGQHDFTTFRSVQCQSASPVKTLDRLDVARDGERVTITAEARSFLHHQVRSMTGCLALVGLGDWPASRIAEALAARDRAALGLNAPPEGLYFLSALYQDGAERVVSVIVQNCAGSIW
jgi:tRNA pseudouridine38-40 synthase